MLKNLKKSNKKGFTLVELVIVIAILAILVAIAIPTISHLIGNANTSVDQSNASMLQTVIKTSTAEASAQTLYGSLTGAGATATTVPADDPAKQEENKTVKSYTVTVENLLKLYGLDIGILNVKADPSNHMVLETASGKVKVAASAATGEKILALDTEITFSVNGTIS